MSHPPPPPHGWQPPQPGQPPYPPQPQQGYPQQQYQQQQPYPQQQAPWPQQQAQQPPQQPQPEQQGQAAAPPPRPGVVTAMAALGGLVAAILLGTAVHLLATGWAESDGGGYIVVVLMALIVGGMGVLYGIGVASLFHKTFPNVLQLLMASWMTAAIAAIGLTRSFRRGGDGPDMTTALVWLVMGAIVVTLIVLMTRPGVKQWISATHKHSIAQGHRPKNRRR